MKQKRTHDQASSDSDSHSKLVGALGVPNQRPRNLTLAVLSESIKAWGCWTRKAVQGLRSGLGEAAQQHLLMATELADLRARLDRNREPAGMPCACGHSSGEHFYGGTKCANCKCQSWRPAPVDVNGDPRHESSPFLVCREHSQEATGRCLCGEFLCSICTVHTRGGVQGRHAILRCYACANEQHTNRDGGHHG